MIFSWFLAGFAAFALGLHLATLVLAARRLRRPLPVLQRSEFVCLLRPVCGIDQFDTETLRSGFQQDYPDYEVILTCASARDPVVALVRRLISEHPTIPARLIIGDLPISANPKLNNVASGWNETRAQIICMTDSNLLLPPDYLRQVMASFRDDTGLVSAPPIGTRAQGLWGALECAFLNSFQGRFQLVADALDHGFAQGKTLCWRRDVAEAGGGLGALGREMAEDVASTKLVRAQGLKVRLAPRLYPQPIGRRHAAQVWQRQLRWARVRRAGFPLLFLPEILAGLVPPLAAISGAVGLGLLPAPLIAIFAAIWIGAEWGFARRAGWPARAIDLLAMLLRDLCLPVLWLWSWRQSGFVWRGNVVAGDSPAAPTRQAE
jgi:ceramide glucosyltransferase